MGPMHPRIQDALTGLRRADLLEQADSARLAALGSPSTGRTGRSVARALRTIADRLDPHLQSELPRIV